MSNGLLTCHLEMVDLTHYVMCCNRTKHIRILRSISLSLTGNMSSDNSIQNNIWCLRCYIIRIHETVNYTDIRKYDVNSTFQIIFLLCIATHSWGIPHSSYLIVDRSMNRLCCYIVRTVIHQLCYCEQSKIINPEDTKLFTNLL